MTEYRDNPYDILGLDEEASEADVKKAYRKLALKFHPDRHTDPVAKQDATSKFAAIANAYEVLSDDNLRLEYDRSRQEQSQKAQSTKGKKSGKKKKNAHDEPQPFRYHFSDPYEVFKRDFRDQFGMEYPGAKYDWVSFDEPVHNGSLRLLGNTTKANDTSTKPKKKGFNPFRRKKSKGDSKPNEQTATNDGALVPYAPGSALAHPARDESRAIVLAEKRNNRPISMDVQSSKEGKVTTTKMTMTRPDGTVETVTMRTGIPGKGPSGGPPKLALGDSSNNKALPSSSKTSGRKSNNNKLLTNGESPKRKLLGWKKM